MEVDNEINRLTVLKSAWQVQQNDLRFNITKRYPDAIAKTTRKIEGYGRRPPPMKKSGWKNFRWSLMEKSMGNVPRRQSFSW